MPEEKTTTTSKGPVRYSTPATEQKRQSLKDDRSSATSEERELAKSDTGDTRTGRHSGSWEGDAEYQKAHAARPAADAAEAARAKATQTGIPEVPGEDTSTHGGSGVISVDPKVQALLDSGRDLEVGGDNILREVKKDKI
jgi:hypothetical protein